MSPNQIVALRVEEARHEKRWTQAETVGRLRRAGLHWSRAGYAMAVGGPKTGRAVRFDADQLVAFASAFERPVWWFLTPPIDWQGRPVDMRLGSGRVLNEDAARLITGAVVVADPSTEEERQRREQEEQRLVEQVMEFCYEHHLLVRPEPLDVSPQVKAELEKATARVLRKNKVKFSSGPWPEMSRIQVEMLAQHLMTREENMSDGTQTRSK
jgi:hypothetical protein